MKMPKIKMPKIKIPALRLPRKQRVVSKRRPPTSGNNAGCMDPGQLKK